MGDIAIVGLSFRLPQDIQDEDGFWDMLTSRKNMMGEWPASRTNIDSFYEPDSSSVNKVKAPLAGLPSPARARADSTIVEVSWCSFHRRGPGSL
jgi:acyl transferase domain-containing protein